MRSGVTWKQLGLDDVSSSRSAGSASTTSSAETAVMTSHGTRWTTSASRDADVAGRPRAAAQQPAGA